MFGSAILEVILGLLALYLLLGAISAELPLVYARLRRSHEVDFQRVLAGSVGEDRVGWLKKSPLVRDRRLVRVPSLVLSVLLEQKLVEEGLLPSRRVPGKVIEPPALAFVFASASYSPERLAAGLEALVLSAFDRANQESRRFALTTPLAVALFLTAALNIDTLAVSNVLWEGPAIRAAITGAVGAPSGTGLEDAFNAISQLDLPAGWLDPPRTRSGWIVKIIGLAITTLSSWVFAGILTDIRRRLISGRVGANPEAERWAILLGRSSSK
jgi:hypothetical protein